MEQLNLDDLEIWRPITGYEGIYDVSSLGRVAVRARRDARGWHRKAGCLTPWPRSKGHYLCVTLCADASESKRYVHELVAEAFIEPRPGLGYQVRHLDGVNTNNRLSNLAWGTPAENAADKIRHGTSRRPQRTHCRNDHELTPKNTYVKPDGERRCRICTAAESHRRRVQRAENREAA